MLRFHFVNNIDPAFTADYFIVWTNLLYACTDFHPDQLLSERLTALKLIFAVSYPTLRKIVRCQFYLNAVARYQSYVMLAHPTGYMSDDSMAIFKFDYKLRSW